MRAKQRRYSALSRRRFLSSSGLAVAGAVMAGSQPIGAQVARASGRGAIDVHHHFLPPAYLAALKGKLNGGDAVLGWTPQRSIEKMDQNGLAASILSISNPGIEPPDPTQRPALARQCNEYGAKLLADYPRRFGLFAALPLPDVDASLKEMTYALDTLHADGIGLMSHYGDAGYIGVPDFAPVYEEMNRRRVIAFIHPRSPYWEGTGDAAERQQIRIPGMGATELPFDTTRAVMNMLSQNITEKYPNIRFILAHSGGTTPFLIQRATVLTGTSSKTPYHQLWDRLAKAMSTFYYDVTNASARPNLKAVLEYASASKLVFGTDVPYGGDGHFIKELLADLPHNGLSEADAEGVRYRNAEALFPRFKQQS